MTVKLVAIDLDGTLLRSDNTISEENREAIRRCMAQGIHIVIATMRSVRSVRPIYADLALVDPIICTGGARIQSSPDGDLWENHTIPQDIALEIARYADARGWSFSTLIDEIAYKGQYRGVMPAEPDPFEPILPTVAEAVQAAPYRFLSYERHALPEIQKLCERYAQHCRVEVFHRRSGKFHSMVILPAAANKGSALKTVSERLNLRPDQVMAIGDHYNDRPMLQFAGQAVVMENAPQDMRDGAKIIAPNHMQHGVAWALNRLALES